MCNSQGQISGAVCWSQDQNTGKHRAKAYETCIILSFCLKGLWTASAGNICHKGFIWHSLALSSPSLIYHSLTARLSVHWDERGSTRWVQTVAYICDKSWTCWISSTYAISVSIDRKKKNPAGRFEESAQQLHNRVDYTAWCKLTI